MTPVLSACARLAGAVLIAGLALAPLARAAPGPGEPPERPSIYQRFLDAHLKRSPRHHQAPGHASSVRQAALALTGVELSADTATGRFDRRDPAPGRLEGGTYLVFWVDESNGEPALFGRRVSAAFAPLGAGGPLYTDDVSRAPDELAGASDGRSLMLLWVDRRAVHVLAAFVDSTGQPTATVTLDETAQPPFVGAPAASTLRPRGFVAAWEEFRSGWHIVGQRLDSTGIRLGANVEFDGGASGPIRITPALAADTGGGFLVAWGEGSATRSDVFVRLFAAGGAPLGPAFALTAPAGTESYLLPAALYVADADHYWIVYARADSPVDSTALFLRRVSRAGTLVDSALALPAGPYPWAPELAASGSNVMVLLERFDNLAEVRALLLNSAASVVGASAVVNQPAPYDREAVAAAGRGDTVAIVWLDRRSGGERIRGRLRAQAASVSPDTLLHAAGVGGSQTGAALVRRPGGGVRAFYRDAQTDDGDVAQVGMREDGTIDERLRVNDDGTRAAQYDVQAAADSTGRSLITWTDERGDWSGPARHAAGRFVAAGGGFLGPAFRIAADSTASSQSETGVALAPGGTAMAVWIDDRSGSLRAFGRFFAADRSPLTGDLTLNDGGVSQIAIARELSPRVSADSAGRFWVMWAVRDAATDSFFALARAYSSAGSPRGATVELSPEGATAAPLAFAIAARPDGSVRVVWAGATAGTQGAWMADYGVDGSVVTTARRIGDSGVAVYAPAVTMDRSGRWAAAWSRQRGLYQEILWQRFHADDSPADTLERISPNLNARLRSSPALATSGTYLYGAWHDNQDPGAGFDVRLSSQIYAPAAVGEPDDSRPAAFALGPNYPNPFNPATLIEYRISEPSHVLLAVYDALGRRVRVLAEGLRLPGAYRSEWDGRDELGQALASGVYFYRLRARDQTLVRKMLLLR